MVWDGVSVFSVEVHRLEVCAVGHIPRLVLPDVFNHFQISLPQKNEVNLGLSIPSEYI